jgi:hypothetical protein
MIYLFNFNLGLAKKHGNISKTLQEQQDAKFARLQYETELSELEEENIRVRA